jgi:hypothetical protein
MTDIEVQFIKTGKGEAFTIGPITLRVLEDGSHTDNREHFLPCVLCELSARTVWFCKNRATYATGCTSNYGALCY